MRESHAPEEFLAATRAAHRGALRWAFVALALLLAAPRGLEAQEARPGDVIEDIQVEGNDFISDEAFLALTTLEAGDTYDVRRLRDEFRKIWRSGLFENLRLEAEPGPGGGVILIWIVEEKPRIDSVRYEKTEAVTPRKIEETLEQNGLTLRPGEPVDEARISQNVKLVEELLSREGYTDATVEVVREQITRHRVSLFFAIDPGLRTRIKKIEFEGNTVFGDEKLRGLMKDTSEHWIGSIFTSNDIYYPTRLQQDVESIVEEYKKRGYLDVRIGDARVEELDKPKDSKDKRWIALTIPVIEGPRYTLGDITFRGNEVFSEDELRVLVPLQRGDVVNDSLVKLGRARIENVYGDRGYIFVSAPHVYERDTEEAVADLAFRINEDQKYFVNRIQFEGNVKTKDEVLRREMRLAEGDVFRRRDFNVSLRKIAQLGYFKLDQNTPDIEKVEEGGDRVDVTIRGEEVARNELQFGGGFSGLDGFFATFSFQSRNFLGRGESIQTFLQLGGRSDRGSLTYVIPYIFNTRNTLGMSLFRRDLEFADFERKGQGGSVWMNFPVRNFSMWSLNYRYEDNETNIVDDLAGDLLFDVTTASLTPSWLTDTRNNPFKPTSGVRFSASLEIADEIMGGDSAFLKPIVEASWRFGGSQIPGRTRPKPYFALHGELGWLLGRQDEGEDVPIFERFFLGGEQSMRAFETRTISPRIVNKITGEESFFGGSQFYTVNFEYAVPFNEFFELAAFLDLGNSWGTDDIDPLSLVDLDRDNDGFPDFTADDFIIEDNDPFSDIRSSIGLETRFYTPVFLLPLRLIFGYNLDPRPGEDQFEFQFSIGRTFE